MRNLFLVILVFFSFTYGIAQPSEKRMTRAEYIEAYKDDAIKEMKRSGVPASITLAQGILESGDGNSPLARKANNHFGIKCHSDWTGKKFIQDDDEKDECFRKYKTVLESYQDHSDFLQKKRYAFLFEYEITDYKAWAKGLKKAGYATNPMYPKLLIDIIEKNNLSQYDQEGYSGRELAKAEVPKPLTDKRPTKSNASHLVKKSANNIHYIEVKEGESYESIAAAHEMGLWQIYKYNDIAKSEERSKGGIIYLQPKRAKAKEDFHTVEKGESMWDISQRYGIKLKKLYKKNRMNKGDEPQVGQRLYLRKNKPN